MPALHNIPRIRSYIPGCAFILLSTSGTGKPALGLALSQLLLQGSRSLTEHFFWPSVQQAIA